MGKEEKPKMIHIPQNDDVETTGPLDNNFYPCLEVLPKNKTWLLLIIYQ